MVRFFEHLMPILAMTVMVGSMLFYRVKRLAPVKVRVIEEDRDPR